MVYQGVIQDVNNVKTQVAIKTIKGTSRSGDILALKGLLGEIKILSHVGNHNHIARLVGAYTAKIRLGQVYMFLEFCQLGALDKLLSKFASDSNNAVESMYDERNGIDFEMIAESAEPSAETLSLLAKWSVQLSDGMEFLAEKGVINALSKFCRSGCAKFFSYMF